MVRERALKVVLMIVGLLFVAAIYPLKMMISTEPALAMMMSLYATLGIFLLRISRNPTAHRSLIAFAGWSSLAHAATMAVMAITDARDRTHLVLGVGIFTVAGVVLLTATPRKAPVLAQKETAA